METERTFCGQNWAGMDNVLTTICELEDRIEMTDQEEAFDIAVQCVSQIMNRMQDGGPINWD